jgi:hypothetical protein
MTNRTKEMDVAFAKKLIVGVKQYLPAASSLTIGSAPLTPAQIEQFLQTLIDLRQAVDDAKSATKAKIAAEDAQAPTLRSQMAALAAIVKASYANSPDVLAGFGLNPRKARTPQTIDEMASAAAKRAATRAARHTLGSKQKQQVKGTITTIVSPPAANAPAPTGASPVANAPTPVGGTSGGPAPHAT